MGLHARLTVAALLAASLAVPAVPARPASVPKDSCEQTFGQSAFAGDPRVVTATVGPSRVQVLLPPSYRTSHRSYPVLYLLHGAQGSADSWLVYSDLLAFTRRLPDAQQAVVVMPDTTLMSGMTLDWADGTHRWESYLVQELPRWVARRFRVRTDRAHTAVAGYSGGGFSALHLAEAHPSRYTAVGAFSPVGSLSFAGTPGELALWGVFSAQAVCDGSDPTGPGVLRDPVSDPAAWAAADPVTGAPRLRGTAVYLAAGNGLPCSATDAQYLPYAVPAAEAAVRRTVDDLDAALTTAGVRHVADLYGCGLHWWPWWQRDLHSWWPLMTARFATAR